MEGHSTAGGDGAIEGIGAHIVARGIGVVVCSSCRLCLDATVDGREFVIIPIADFHRAFIVKLVNAGLEFEL